MLRAFMTMLIESIKRHQLWNMMPWDPGDMPEELFVLWSDPVAEQPAAFFLSLQ